MISLVIGDDQRIFAEALMLVFTQQGFRVPAVAYTLETTVNAVRAKQPDVCLVERRFHDHEASETLPAIIGASQNVKVVVLSGDGEPESIANALGSGAAGYVHKTRGIAVLSESIQRVVDGEIIVDARPEQVRRRAAAVSDVQRLAVHLTARERECLSLMVEGMDTKAMAQRLGVATTTIRSHVQATLTKLGTHSRLEAAALTVRYHLLGSESERPPTREGPIHLERWSPHQGNGLQPSRA